MSATIALRCSNCAATATAKPADNTMVCEYCGTVSLIKRRTGFFERARAPEHRDEPEYRKLPVSTQRRSRWWLLKAIGPFLPGIAVLVFFGHLHAALKWHGEGVPILVDVNRDGVADVVGRFERGGWNLLEKVRIAAIDGRSGEVLWQSQVLEWTESYGVQGSLALKDGIVVFTHFTEGNWQGPTLGYDLATGKLLWRGAGLPARNPVVCGRPGALAYKTGHQRYAVLDLQSRLFEEHDGELDCEPVTTDRRTPPVTSGLDGVEGVDAVGRMDPYVAVRARGSQGPWAVVGKQASGPDAHWVGVVEPGPKPDIFPEELTLRWEKEVAKSPGIAWQSLTASVSDTALFSSYAHERDEETFVAAHSLADGTQLWKVEIGNVRVSSIGHATDRVYVVGPRLFRILDAKSGAELVEVGPL